MTNNFAHCCVGASLGISSGVEAITRGKQAEFFVDICHECIFLSMCDPALSKSLVNRALTDLHNFKHKEVSIVAHWR